MKNTIRTEDAIAFYGGRGKGGVQKLADALEITHGAISQWGEFVPELQAYKLQGLTGGALGNQQNSQPMTAA